MINPNSLRKLAVGGLVLSLLTVLCGCGEAPPPVSEDTKKQQDQLEEIRNRTGYDYSKTTDADKAALLKICNGDAGCPKMLLFKPGAAGGPKPPTPGMKRTGPGGPPAGIGG